MNGEDEIQVNDDEVEVVETAIEEAIKDMPDDDQRIDPEDKVDSEEVVDDAEVNEEETITDEGADDKSDKPDDDGEADKKEEAKPKEEDDPEKEADDGDSADKDDYSKDEQFSEENLKGRTKERFDSLLERSKATDVEKQEMQQQFETLEQDHKSLMDGILGGGLDVEEVADGVRVMENLKNGNISQDDIKKVQDFVNNIELFTGYRFQNFNPVGDFPDLQKQVDSLEITQDAALELARGRKVKEMGNAQKQNYQQQQQAEQQTADELNQGVKQAEQVIAGKLADYEKKDPDFKVKRQLLWDSFQKQAQEGLSKKEFTPAHLPKLLENIYNQVTLEIRVNNKKPAPNTMRQNGTKTASTPKDVDIDGDDWVSELMGSIGQ